MFRQLPRPYTASHNRILSRCFINHVGHPSVPARFYLISVFQSVSATYHNRLLRVLRVGKRPVLRIVFLLFEVHPSCSYCRFMSLRLLCERRMGRTWEFLLEVLIVFVAESIGANQGSGFGITCIIASEIVTLAQRLYTHQCTARWSRS